MRGLIDIERKGYESIGCYTYYVTFSYVLNLEFSSWNFEKISVIGMGRRIDMEKTGFKSIGLWTLTSPMTLTLDFQGKILKLLYLRNERIDSLRMKGMWVRYDVGCTMGLTLGHGACHIDRPIDGSMWNSYSFQPVGLWMGFSFTDLGAEGYCRSLNALLQYLGICATSLQIYFRKADIKIFQMLSCVLLRYVFVLIFGFRSTFFFCYLIKLCLRRASA